MADLSFLTIEHAPNKTSYKAGDRFERYGMSVMAHYSDGTTSTVPFFGWSPTGPLTENDQSVSISFMDKTVTQPISVSPVGDEGYFPSVCLRGAELGGNPAINAGDASVRYRCRPIKVGRDAYEVSLSLVYSSRMTDVEAGLIQGLPKGWRTNLHRFLVQDGRDQAGNDMYRYIDGDGYVHTFRYDAELCCHADSDGCGLTLDLPNRTVSDRDGNSMVFDSQGRLISISETNGKTTVVEYNANGLRKVYDPRRPLDYIKLSYDAMSSLRWIRVFKNNVEKKIYDVIGMPNQISSVRESAGGSSRELHMFSVNDRDRVNRMVDRLTGEAYRVTYDFDADGLNDYIFSSVRAGHMEDGSFVEKENGAAIRLLRRMDGSNPSLITELRLGVGDELETQHGIDSMGRIASSFESIGSGRELRSLVRLEGDPVGHNGQARVIVNGSVADSFLGTLYANEGLPSEAFGGSVRLRLCGYAKAEAGCGRARLSFSHLSSTSRRIDLNPHAEDVWQYFQIPFVRETDQDGNPLPFEDFTVNATDQDGDPILTTIADLRFMRPDDDPAAVFEAAGGTVRFEDLAAVELVDSAGVIRSVDVAESEFSFAAADLISTLRRRASFGDSPARVYLNGGERAMATYGGLTLVFQGGQRIDAFDASELDNSAIGNGRNWYLSEGDELDNRVYLDFGAGSWSTTRLTTRPSISGGAPERLTSKTIYDYCDRPLEEHQADGGGFRCEYFDDGTLRKKTAVSDGGDEIVVHEESRNGDSIAVAEDGVTSTSTYDGDLLVEATVPGSNGQAKASLSYDDYMESVSSVAFLSGSTPIAGNTLSESASGLLYDMSDGAASYRLERSAGGDGAKAYIMAGGAYSQTFERAKLGSFRTDAFYNDGQWGARKEVTEARDPYGKTLAVFFDNTLKATLTYEPNRQSRSTDELRFVSDSFSGRETTIEYSAKGDVSSIETDGLTVEYGDEPGKDSATLSFAAGDTYLRESNGASSVLSSGGDVVFGTESSRDAFGRICNKTVHSNGCAVEQNYFYQPGKFFRISGFGFGSIGDSYSHYGASGRLSARSSYFPAFMVSRAYCYDGFGRLASETNSRSGMNRSYAYSGCRMSHFGDKDITYDDRGRMTGFGDTTFYYDNCGNTLSKCWPNGYATYSYDRGRLLASVVINRNADEINFQYDREGKRTRKSLRNGDAHEYHYDGGRLVGEDIANDCSPESNLRIRYFHDPEGIIGFCVYGLGGSQARTDFTYIKNPSNEIIGIAWGDELVAIYDYDAWGNHRVLNPDGSENGSADFIGNINPIRYRAYYYDKETGLYFLNSRYYDPEIGRFITPDSYDYLDSMTIGGIDLYAYCNNDPVNYSDPTGHAWYDILAWIGVGLVAAAAIVLTAGMAGAVIGGIAGGVIYGAAIGTLALGTVGAASGAVGGMIYDAVEGNSFGTSIWTGTKIGFGVGAISGAAIGGTIGGFASASVSGLTNASFWTGLGKSGESIAASAANGRGLITLGQTFGGKCASAMTKMFGYGGTRFLWASLSKTMASTVAMGSVTLFYGGSIDEFSICVMHELPELIERGIEILPEIIKYWMF